LKREALLKLYSDTEGCVEKMADEIIALLEKKVGNIKEKMTYRRTQLEREEYFLLVAGK